MTHTRNEQQQATFKRWVESHTPEQIQQANNARLQLRKKYPKQKTKWAKIPDERVPKRPASPFAVFNTNRQASGDFNGIKLTEAVKLVGQEWKALSSSEKEVCPYSNSQSDPNLTDVVNRNTRRSTKTTSSDTHLSTALLSVTHLPVMLLPQLHLLEFRIIAPATLYM